MGAIQRLLIANRGEIACRVIRSAKAMGVTTIAVYSDADAGAPHVKLADEAVHIGPAPVNESYLVIDGIIEAAKAARADAVHPGYGFLSERAPFAEACAKAGIVFVGPSAAAIEAMGDKAGSKRLMIEAGVPCVPGYQGADQSDERFMAAAEEIGFPLMVKASAGGGGKGMRLVEKKKDLKAALSTARSEALSAFGSDELILERAIIRPRHVEIQVMGDSHGTVLHLGERDCSVQRRHQKVLEEAPSPVMTEALRAAMGEAAVKAAQAVDYVGAGTVEFLLGEDGAFYFLEMNTRLQVEHPVTEEVTGLDLVALQLRVAEGAPIGFGQEDVTLSGHAIEARLYAEDPAQDFLPSSGGVALWAPPSGEGVRVDDGVETGGEISPFYDPMVAKIIAKGATREEARRRLVRALRSSALIGPATNRDFLIDALERESFAEGRATTAFIAEEYGDAGFAPQPQKLDLALAALLQTAEARSRAQSEALAVSTELMDWASAGELRDVHFYQDGEDLRRVDILTLGGGRYRAEIDDESFDLELLDYAPPHALVATPAGRRPVLFHSRSGAEIVLASEAGQFALRARVPGESDADEAGSGRVAAPMHGKLIEIFAEEGAKVAKGDRLAIMEAMKMQHEILAGVDGTVSAVHGEAGAQIAADDLIMEIDPAEKAEKKE